MLTKHVKDCFGRGKISGDLYKGSQSASALDVLRSRDASPQSKVFGGAENHLPLETCGLNHYKVARVCKRIPIKMVRAVRVIVPITVSCSTGMVRGVTHTIGAPLARFGT